ncbi:MAG TPA: hypothetical protein VFA22_08155 [Stellaceae bacterium]|nr:hypothetical protein [Stellaceae bacterium]
MTGPGLFERVRGRGVAFVLRRALREVYAPETGWGRALRPLTAGPWAAFRAAHDAFRARPAHAPAAWADTFTLFYDLDECPITYDFVTFLVQAEAMRRQAGLARLAVVFVEGRKDGLRPEMRAYEEAIDLESRRWRLHNICIPLTTLLPACRSYAVLPRAQAAAVHRLCGERFLPAGYSPAFPLPPQGREVTRLAAEGHELKLLASPPRALAYVESWLASRRAGRKLVTITLRQSPFMPQRNSNLPAWSAFARSLDPRAFFVVIVPDTDSALTPLPEGLADFTAFTAACWNIGLRSALYESAWLNLGSSGGPLALCWFNPKARYIMFKIVVDDVPQATARFLEERGYVVGAPPPFLGPYQEWVWEADDLAVIERAFARMAARLPA